MVDFIDELEGLLPESLHEPLSWDFIPWSFVKERHHDMPGPSLTALFDAYQRIGKHFDLEALVLQKIPEDSWGCMRCGFCCSSMRPGPVKASVIRAWEKAGAPAAWFYKPRRKAGKNSVYRCWYNDGVRLRICPFMFLNRYDSKPLCAIYHMGDEMRPQVCSKYVPRHETCTAEQLVLEPWESN